MDSAAFPFLRCFIAVLISALLGLLVLMSRGAFIAGISGDSDGTGRLKSSWKRSFHLCSCAFVLVRRQPFLFLTGCSATRLFPANFLVMIETSFMFFIPAASSACLHRSSTKFLLSVFTHLFPYFFIFSLYRCCASAFAALVLLLCKAVLHSFLSLILDNLPTDIHSLCCFFLLPKTVSHVSFHTSLVCSQHCSMDASSSVMSRSASTRLESSTWNFCLVSWSLSSFVLNVYPTFRFLLL